MLNRSELIPKDYVILLSASTFAFSIVLVVSFYSQPSRHVQTVSLSH